MLTVLSEEKQGTPPAQRPYLNQAKYLSAEKGLKEIYKHINTGYLWGYCVFSSQFSSVF